MFWPAWVHMPSQVGTLVWWEQQLAIGHSPASCRPPPRSPLLCRGWAWWSWGGRSTRWRLRRRGRPRRCSCPSCRWPSPRGGRRGRRPGRSGRWSCWPVGLRTRTWRRRSLEPRRRRGKWLHSRQGRPRRETRKRQGKSSHLQSSPPFKDTTFRRAIFTSHHTSPASPGSTIPKREDLLLSIQARRMLPRKHMKKVVFGFRDLVFWDLVRFIWYLGSCIWYLGCIWVVYLKPTAPFCAHELEYMGGLVWPGSGLSSSLLNWRC